MSVRLMLALLIGAAALAADAGTLIYRTRDGLTRTATQVKIVSIDSKLLTLKINDGTETIALSQLVKYYDTDIRGSDFDDATAAYDILLGDSRCPATGRTGGKDNRTTSVFKQSYTVRRKRNEPVRGELREPYFYLFVLTSSGGERNFFSFASPAEAKVSMKNYDEARMLEKVISLKRSSYHEADRDRLGKQTESTTLGGGRTATFKLDGIKDQQIIAWYLVAWGKNGIEATKNWSDHSYTIRKNWWIR